MDNNLYEKTLREVRKSLESPSIKRTDSRKMSSRQKSEKIVELEDEIISLKRELLIRRSVYDRCISGLINDKTRLTNELLRDPIITLPSGTQVKFSSLNDSQLEYLENIAAEKKEAYNEICRKYK
mgnify:FL=1